MFFDLDTLTGMKLALSLALSLALATRSTTAHGDAVQDAIARDCPLDARLDAVARAALEHHDPLDPAMLHAAAETQGLFVPNVRAWIARGQEDLVSRLASQWLARQRTHPAWSRCATARAGEVWAVVMVPRLAEIVGPRGLVTPGTHARYAIALPTGATHAALFVLRPDGAIVRTQPDTGVMLDREGTYTLQVIADTAYGPLPFATWHVTVGNPAPHGSSQFETNSETNSETISDPRQILVGINRQRQAMGIPPLRPDPLLTSVATEYARQIAQRGLVAHSLTPGDSPAARLRSAWIVADRVAENVARAPTLAAANARLNQSPSHRANRLDPAIDAVGIGIAPANGQVYLVELFAARPRLASR